jgi:hypothetical protein
MTDGNDSTLADVRAALVRALGLVDTLIAQQPTGRGRKDLSRHRIRPGGPLTDEAVAEITNRFEQGQSDSVIALAMGISLVGVSRRRTAWRRNREGK